MKATNSYHHRLLADEAADAHGLVPGDTDEEHDRGEDPAQDRLEGQVGVAEEPGDGAGDGVGGGLGVAFVIPFRDGYAVDVHLLHALGRGVERAAPPWHEEDEDGEVDL